MSADDAISNMHEERRRDRDLKEIRSRRLFGCSGSGYCCGAWGHWFCWVCGAAAGGTAGC